jgi:uncharacterized protein YggE
MLAIGCVSTAAAQSAQPSVPAIVTTGEAVVRRAPDRVFVTASVESRARDPREAQGTNAKSMTAVQNALRQAGIPDEAIRTLGYSIERQIDYIDGRQVLRDYLARNAVEVRLDDIDRAGEILDLVVQAGATTVSGVRFDLRDRAGVEREAVRLAVVDARARAEAAAAGVGRSLGDVLKIEDAFQSPEPPRPMIAFAREAADAQVGTPVAPGEIEIRAQVTLTIAIR